MKSLLIALLVAVAGFTLLFSGCGSDCQPSCQGLCGGSDGCGDTCPDTCPTGQSCIGPKFDTCKEECTPNCGSRVCGADPVCGQSCGVCSTGFCKANGQCDTTCTPNCGSRVCGADPVCGQSCGSCNTGYDCNANGQCVANCIPNCGSRVCGADPVCGESCGSCSGADTCVNGQCVPPGRVMPRAGLWSYSDWTYTENACGVEIAGEGDGGFSVSNVADPSFTVTPGDGGNPFLCTFSGATYSCHRGDLEDDLSNYGIDARLQGSVDVSGTMSDAQHTSGQQIGTASCSGTQCAAAAAYLQTSFPCSFTVAFHGAWMQ